MRIVILGAGQVGDTLARNLAHEDNDITLIDHNAERLRELQHRMDIKTIHGAASHPNILKEAGIEQADMLIAVTSSDEVNMMACQVAYSLCRTPNKIARIRSKNYYQCIELFSPQGIPIDVCISPERLVTDHIVNLIRFPGTAQVLDFAEGKVLLVTVKPEAGELMVGKTVQQLKLSLNKISASVIAIFRHKQVIPMLDMTTIDEDDEVIFIAAPLAIQQVLSALGRVSAPNRRIMIGGGGHIGARLALSLESRYRLKIIEHNPSTADQLAIQLSKSTVLAGNIADRELLLNENIEFTDVFCAVTNDDEANIMSSLQAKRLGARYALALVNRRAYVDLIDDSRIDHAISPQSITIGSILAKLRRGNMVKVHRLPNDEAEAIELILHGNETSSQVIGRCVHEIDMPPSCLIAGIVRGEHVHVVTDDFKFAKADHVILLVLKKRYVRHIEALFQVNLSFMG